ncbi:hypothetical protein F5887DRAFT_943819 [Amanita rubescens]|nr:hypothetical protein F5887DRAFT_943819 [Amanita rubescens]
MTSVSSKSPTSTLREHDTQAAIAHHTSTHNTMMKRIIVLCDGTWQDGLAQKCTQYTNIMRLARSIHYKDNRHELPVPQIVYYLSGVGSGNSTYSYLVDGVTGISIVEKIEAGYGFIAQNYHPGDEIFLFGFSRGAYTARIIATLIGQLGILDRKDMDNFADIFKTYQKMGDAKDETELANLRATLSRWTDPNSTGKRRANLDGDDFTIKCVCVFDTVNSVGLPEEISLTRAVHPLFGLHDKKLGKHVERAYQALALDEKRVDFSCLKFVQSDAGRQKGQVLKQCWFSGSHSDIGGGFAAHDLADLTLMWIAGQIGDILSLDMQYLAQYLEPVAPWGKQTPHDPSTGFFTVATVSSRPLPSLDDTTQETVHPSVLEQDKLPFTLKDYLSEHPELVHRLTPLEEEWKRGWPYNPDDPRVQHYKLKANQAEPDNDRAPASGETMVKRSSLIIKLMKASGLRKEVTVASVKQKTAVAPRAKSGIFTMF